jgi:hypothetical protein
MRLRQFTNAIALVLLALAPVVAGGVAAIWVLDQESAAAQDVLRARGKQLTARVDAELDRTVAILKTMSVSSALQSGDLQGFHALAVQVVKNEPQWENVQLIGTNGEHLVNARLPYGAALPSLNRPDLPMKAAFSGQTVISDVEMAVVAKRMLTVVYVPVVRDGGKVTNVIAAAIEPPNWTGVLRSLLPAGVDAALLDRHHFVITSTLDTPNRNLAGLVEANPSATRPGELLSDIKWMRSGSGEALYAAEETSTYSGWKVMTFMPRTQAGVFHEHWRLVLLVGAGGLAVYWGLLWVAFARRPLSS